MVVHKTNKQKENMETKKTFLQKMIVTKIYFEDHINDNRQKRNENMKLEN